VYGKEHGGKGMKKISSNALLGGGLTILVVGVFSLLVWFNHKSNAATPTTPTTPANSGNQPIVLVQATAVGAIRFADGDTTRGGHGQTVDGVQVSTEQSAYHVHAHLTIFINGVQVAVPKGIGITPPRTVEQNFVTGGSDFYWLHTHDETGIIHIEAPQPEVFTLGQFFDIWGETLSSSQLAGEKGQVVAYVNGTPYRGSPRNIPLGDHTEITIEVGQPVVNPPVYQFPAETP